MAMNGYKREFLKEVAAQIAGYEPSQMWGRMTNARPRHPLKHYEHLVKHDNWLDTTALGHVQNIGSKIKKGLKAGSNILKHLI